MSAESLRAVADEELMLLVQQDDSRAFSVLYDRHSGIAHGLARRICATPERAADATQEAFLSLWRQRLIFEPSRGALRSWLLLIVRNKAVDSVRRTGPTDRRQADDDGLAEQLEAPDRVDEEVMADIEAADVRGALERLPAAQRRAIELAFLDGLSHAEVARSLQVATGTVKGRIRLGLDKLRSDRAIMQIYASPARTQGLS